MRDLSQLYPFEKKTIGMKEIKVGGKTIVEAVV